MVINWSFVVVIGYDNVVQMFFQICKVGCQIQDCYNFRGYGDVKIGFMREVVGYVI